MFDKSYSFPLYEIDDKLIHPSKALFPIDLTEFGTDTLDSFEHFTNAPVPISVTELAIVTLVISLQSRNA